MDDPCEASPMVTNFGLGFKFSTQPEGILLEGKEALEIPLAIHLSRYDYPPPSPLFMSLGQNGDFTNYKYRCWKD
jgi:hypothetical protein